MMNSDKRSKADHPGVCHIVPQMTNKPHRDLTGQVTKGDRLACGGLSDVYEGKWRNPATGETVAVAIKILRGVYPTDEARKKQSERLNRETWVWDELIDPNILPFLGLSSNVGDKTDAPALISPLCTKGDITRFLKENGNADRLEMAVGIAKGLRYLHLKDIIHGDLKPTNILVSEDGKPLLCDFGRSRIIGHRGFTSRVIGVLLYQAPELHGLEGVDTNTGSEYDPTDESPVEKENFSDKLTKQTDTYAYAMVALEVLTGKTPYYYANSKIIHIIQGIQLQRGRYNSPLLTDAHWALLAKCWAKDPTIRPDVDTIIQILA